jgi:hypothetical protein
MISKTSISSAQSVEGFSRLFSATAMAFERDASRLSRQIHTLAPRATHKRSNGK